MFSHTHTHRPTSSRDSRLISSHLISSHLSVPAKFEERREKIVAATFLRMWRVPRALGRPFNFKKEKLKVGNPGSMRSRLPTLLPFFEFLLLQREDEGRD